MTPLTANAWYGTLRSSTQPDYPTNRNEGPTMKDLSTRYARVIAAVARQERDLLDVGDALRAEVKVTAGKAKNTEEYKDGVLALKESGYDRSAAWLRDLRITADRFQGKRRQELLDQDIPPTTLVHVATLDMDQSKFTFEDAENILDGLLSLADGMNALSDPPPKMIDLTVKATMKYSEVFTKYPAQWLDQAINEMAPNPRGRKGWKLTKRALLAATGQKYDNSAEKTKMSADRVKSLSDDERQEFLQDLLSDSDLDAEIEAQKALVATEEAAVAVAEVHGIDPEKAKEHYTTEVEAVAHVTRTRQLAEPTSHQERKVQATQTAQHVAGSQHAATEKGVQRNTPGSLAHSVTYLSVRAKAIDVRRKLTDMLNEARGVEFTEEEQVNIQSDTDSFRALSGLIDSAVTGVSGVDWDDALAKLTP